MLEVMPGCVEVVPTFVVAYSGSGRVSSGGSIDMVLTFSGASRAVVGGALSVGGTAGADDALTFEGMAELEDCMFCHRKGWRWSRRRKGEP